MNRKRILLIGGWLLILILAVGIYFLFSSLDSIVKESIEYHGARITGSSVTVGDVEISLREGRGSIRGIRVANPSGFSDEAAFTLEEITLAIDLASLSSDPIVINEVSVIAPQVRLETNDQGKSNLEVLTEKLRSSPPSTQESEEVSSKEKKLRIKQFVFEKGTIFATIPNQTEEMKVEFPGVRMSDVGGSSGQTSEIVGQEIMREFLRVCIRAVSRKGIQELIDRKLGESGEAVKGVLDKILK